MGGRETHNDYFCSARRHKSRWVLATGGAPLAADELLRAHRNLACMDLSLEFMAFDNVGCYVSIESARRRPATSSALRGNKVPVILRHLLSSENIR
jgi:hypothetical protein